MPRKKLSVLLCEDQPNYYNNFYEKQCRYFNVTICDDVHGLLDRLRDLDENNALPDVVLLDLFSKRDDVDEDEEFCRRRQKIDTDIEDICKMLTETSKEAREILYPHGIDILKDIRKEFPEFKLPILLYSRLGPYILQPDEAADVDEYNAEFLLKWIDHDEQRKKIRRFFYKWRSQEQPTDLEISRKLSSLPPRLAEAVADALKNGKYQEAITSGFLVLDDFLKISVGCEFDGNLLRKELGRVLLAKGNPRAGEKHDQFKRRVETVIPNLYYSVFILIRSFYMHGRRMGARAWREVDMCLSIYNLIWREVDESIGRPTQPLRRLIGASNVKKAAKFYRDILGLEIEYLTDQWAELKPEGKDIELVIRKVDAKQGANSSGVGFAVVDCAAITRRLKEKGVDIVRDNEFSEEWGGYFTQIRDPDGEVVWFCEKTGESER